MAAALAVGAPATEAGNIFVFASPDSATNLVGTDHTVLAEVAQGANPAPDWAVTFDVLSGPNAGYEDDGISDSNGHVEFTYTGAGGAGQDVIEVCVTVFTQAGSGASGITPMDCDTVTKDWEDPTPTPTPVPSATPTAVPVATAPASELPDTGSGPGGGSGFPWTGAIALALGGAAVLVGGAALTRREP